MKTCKLILSIFFMLSTYSVFAQEWTGNYHCSGYDPLLQRNYSATLTISERDNIYYAIWHLDTGRIFRGMGLSEHNVLSLGFGQTTEPAVGNSIGTSIYVIENNQLTGRWVFLHHPHIGVENCRRVTEPAS